MPSGVSVADSATWHEDVIDIVHEKLDELLGRPMPYRGGKKERQHTNCHPLIVWAPTSNCGKVGESTAAGGNPTPIGLDTCQYVVTIWHSSKANCRATLHNLVVAARLSKAKSSVRIGTKYDFPREAHADAGVIMLATCEVDIRVTDEVCVEVRGDDLAFETGFVEEHGDGTREVIAGQLIPEV